VEGRNGGNSRNGTRAKTVLTEAAGEVSVEVPWDRAGTFEPVVVRQRQRRLSDVDAVAISLYAKGLTTGEISAHFAEVSPTSCDTPPSPTPSKPEFRCVTRRILGPPCRPSHHRAHTPRKSAWACPTR
jgi:hypothetical protein